MYVFVLFVFMLLVGLFGDCYGYKCVWFVSVILFMVGLIVCVCVGWIGLLLVGCVI